MRGAGDTAHGGDRPRPRTPIGFEIAGRRRRLTLRKTHNSRSGARSFPEESQGVQFQAHGKPLGFFVSGDGLSPFPVRPPVTDAEALVSAAVHVSPRAVPPLDPPTPQGSRTQSVAAVASEREPEFDRHPYSAPVCPRAGGGATALIALSPKEGNGWSRTRHLHFVALLARLRRSPPDE